MIPMILFVAFAIIALICLAFSVYKSIELVRNPSEKVDLAKHLKNNFYFSLGFSAAFTLMLVMVYPWAKISPKPYEVIEAVLGGLVFSSSLIIATNTFILHYYRKNISIVMHKRFFRIMMGAFILTAITFFVTLNGFADYLSYPLVNGIDFKGRGFVTPREGGAQVAFYAICILSGALFVYALGDHKMYIKYGKHGLLESTFLVAFPAGIIGARIAYVIGNFNVPVDKGGFGGVFSWDVFKIWNGGLTILGGAIAGIVVGVAWFMWRNKKISVWDTIDICVPLILIAQAMGRWGNFFNCEVHGLESNEEYWWWLPRIVFNNAHYSTATGAVVESSAGTLFVPLFFIESIINLFGFGLLSHLFGKKLNKATEPGDLAFGYVAFYGLIRTLLEPLRDASYNMGKDGYWSWLWSMIFIACGCLLILGNHVVRYFIKKKKNELIYSESYAKTSLICSICLGTLSVALLATAIVLLVNGTFVNSIVYNMFNVGVMTLIVSLSLGMIFAISLFNYLIAKKGKADLVTTDEQA